MHSSTSLDTVSNNVAKAVAQDILQNGVLPDLQQIGRIGAGKAINGYFHNDTAGWSGNPLFIFLGESSFYREKILDKE